MAINTRKRFITFREGAGRQTTRSGTGAITYQSQPFSIVGKQETASESITGWRLREDILHGAKYTRNWTSKQKRQILRLDMGSEFTTKRNFYSDTLDTTERKLKPLTDYQVGVLNPLPQTSFTYHGPFFAHDRSVTPSSTIWPVLAYPDEALITTLGATAIARCIPTNPVSDAMTFLGELRNDGLPSIIGTSLFKEKALFFKNLGGEYLNVEFGWKPFISDLQKFAFAAKNSKEILDQYIRDSGRGVRRRYVFPTATVSEVIPIAASKPQPALVTSYYRNGTTFSPKTKTRETTVDYWFSGCFTYALNLGSSTTDKMELHKQLAEKLIGLELTPEVLWNLAPWSWAVDWAVNIGDVLHNLTAFAQDGLVMRYGYMMAHSVIKDTYTLEASPFYGGDVGPLYQTFGTEIKVRRKATPFGFGLSFDGFNNRQLAILAALGLSRGTRRS